MKYTSGYIDLSKRRVENEDVIKCEERYNKAKAVHSLMRYVAETQQIKLENLYQIVGWPLYRKYGHAYDAFKIALSGSDEDIFEGLEISETIKSAILSYVKRRLAPQPIKIRSDIEVTCFNYEGIDAIKQALLAGEIHGTPEVPIKIRLIAPPMYVISTLTSDKELGIEMLTQAIEIIRSVILSNGGSLDVKIAPKAVTVKEESELQAMLDRLIAEQEDVEGDDFEES